MARDTIDSRPLTSVDELTAYIAAGSKPKDQWRIGTEHEKFAFYRDGNRPVGCIHSGGLQGAAGKIPVRKRN